MSLDHKAEGAEELTLVRSRLSGVERLGQDLEGQELCIIERDLAELWLLLVLSCVCDQVKRVE